MTDIWQPSVLQLMPFASNNANSQDEIPYQEERVSTNRGFPRLAVTRVHTFKGKDKIARSVSKYASRSKDYHERSRSVPGSRTNSEYSTRTKMATGDVGYSVNDLNDQIIYSSKICSENYTSKHWSSNSGMDLFEPVQCLPKPNIARTLDGRYFMPQNGFWRAVTMTPGETDLHKQRGSASKHQYKKPGKKHKVNINSIPRSTTPITDYDPDKLNMKHVIAFLQKNNTDVRNDAHLSENQELVERESDKSRSSSSGNRLENSETSDSPTETRSLRVRASDKVPTMEQRFKHSSKTTKHVNRKDTSTHHAKPFRLHRFLTVAAQKVDPCESISKHSYTKSVHIDKCSDKTQSSMLPKKVSTPLSFPLTKQSSGKTKTQEHYRNVYISEEVIRLPNMFDIESEADEEIDCPSQVPTERQKRCFDTDEIYKNFETDVSPRGYAANKSGTLTKTIPVRSKQLQLSLPDQTINPQPTNDQVRLTLRKERTLTRQNTYMSDLDDSRSNLEHRESILSSVCSFRQECIEQ